MNFSFDALWILRLLGITHGLYVSRRPCTRPTLSWTDRVWKDHLLAARPTAAGSPGPPTIPRPRVRPVKTPKASQGLHVTPFEHKAICGPYLLGALSESTFLTWTLRVDPPYVDPPTWSPLTWTFLRTLHTAYGNPFLRTHLRGPYAPLLRGPSWLDPPYVDPTVHGPSNAWTFHTWSPLCGLLRGPYKVKLPSKVK